MSCFPAIFRRRACQRKNSSQDNVGKVLNARVWPGDDGFSPKSEEQVPSTLSGTDIFHASGRKSFPSVQSEEQAKPGAVSGGDDVTAKEGSDGASMEYVKDWVNSLDERENEDPQFDDAEAEEMKCTCRDVPDGETEAGTSESELNSIVVKSVSPLATSAHLSALGIKVVPFLGAFNNLRRLSLSANSIVRIPPGCLPRNLHLLDLSKNKISSIEGLRNLSRLRILNLSHNKISRIGHGLGNCTSIRELYLAGNKISAVEGLHRLRKLRLVDLGSNRLTTAKSLAQLAANYSCLQVLNLVDNPVLSNLGEEQLRRLLSVMVPHLTYLNKQPLKPVAPSEAGVAKFGSGIHSRKSRKSGLSKAKRVESLRQTISSMSRSGRHF